MILMGIEGSYDLKIDEKSGSEYAEQIKKFIAENGLVLEQYVYKNRILWFIDCGQEKTLALEKVHEYIDEQLKLEAEKSLTTCYFVAAVAAKEDGLTGCFDSKGVDNLVSYYTHAINYEMLPDGSFIALDFTAANLIDKNQGNLHVLAMRAKNIEELCQKLNCLYGGDWKLIPSEKVNFYYRLARVSSDQELAQLIEEGQE